MDRTGEADKLLKIQQAMLYASCSVLSRSHELELLVQLAIYDTSYAIADN